MSKCNCTHFAFASRLQTVHRADFALLEGNGTIVGVKTGGHADGEVWGYWAVRSIVICGFVLPQPNERSEDNFLWQVTGQRVRSEVWSSWAGMEAMVAGDTVVRETRAVKPSLNFFAKFCMIGLLTRTSDICGCW